MTTQRHHDLRAGQLRSAMLKHVEHNDVPGMVTLVSRYGEARVDAIGMKAVGGSDPMERDTIFRIASMTKPIVAALAMILVDEGGLRLDDPVDTWLPELADRQVLKRLDGPIDETVPAQRRIALRDLLTLCLGFGYITAAGSYPIQDAASKAQILSGPPDPPAMPNPDEWMRRLGELPLMYQPGERWMYPTGFTVLGILLERSSGMALDQLLQERLLEPLGMIDTGFFVPRSKLNRLAACYAVNANTGRLELYDGAADSKWSQPPALADANGGMVSTVDDYLAFGAMLLNRGEHGGRAVLSRSAVELMTSNQITAEQKAGTDFLGDQGWGFGVSVFTGHGDGATTPGRFGWDGGFRTSWYSDPKAGLVGVLMTQVLGSPARIDLDFWGTVYGSKAD